MAGALPATFFDRFLSRFAAADGIAAAITKKPNTRKYTALLGVPVDLPLRDDLHSPTCFSNFLSFVMLCNTKCEVCPVRLQLIESRVEALGFQQLFVSAALDDAALVDH